jgi:hypothetical protein
MAIQKYYKKSLRVELFGSICGVLNSHKYSPPLFSTFCSLLRISCVHVPDIVSFLRNYPAHVCWVPIGNIIKAVEKTFQDAELKIEDAVDAGLIYLPMDRRAKVNIVCISFCFYIQQHSEDLS